MSLPWKKAPTGMVKINWDVAIDNIKIGIIVRDYEGEVLAAWSFTKNILVESVGPKTLTALYAVEFAREMSVFFLLILFYKEMPYKLSM